MKKIQMIDVMRLVAEHKEADAKALMKQFIIQQSRDLNEQFMAEELESELSIGDELEAELAEVDPELDGLSDEIDSEMILDDGSDELEDLEGSDIVDELEDRVDSVEDAVDSVEDAVAALRAEFEELMNDEAEEAEEDELETDVDSELEGDVEVSDELDGELEGEESVESELSSDIEEIQDEELS